MRPHNILPALSIVVGLGLASGYAQAAGKKDKEAEKLINKAMDEDYLAVEFDKAEANLKKALETCGTKNCSPEMLGKVHVALATVHGVGQSKLDVAKNDLVNALKADPKAALIEGLTTPELEAKLKEAQAEVGGGGAGGAAGTGGDAGTGGAGTAGGTAAPAPSGDFSHTPIAEQAIHYPVPIFAEIPAEIGATKVVARYKPYGGLKWETLQLEKVTGGFAAEVPCSATSTSGDLKYYIIGSDESGTPVATGGSLKNPYKVPVKNKIQGDPAGLPGKPPPKRCEVKEDCPPGLPGCGSAGREGLVEGSLCAETQECAGGLICESGVCTPGEDPDADAGPDDGRQNHFIYAGAQLDIAYIGDGEGVCTDTATYICVVTSTGKQFFGDPGAVQGTNGISGGLGIGGARILAGYDYFFDFGLGLGARLGFAFGGPSLDGTAPEGRTPANSFLPIHGEGRASWRFLNGSMKGGDFSPHVFAGGGVAQVNASVPVTVCDTTAPPGSNSACPGETKVDAYQLTGLSFVGFGGGATYMIVDNFGLNLDLKFMVLVPTVGFVIAPALSPVLSF